jgi:hypothetical protein
MWHRAEESEFPALLFLGSPIASLVAKWASESVDGA